MTVNCPLFDIRAKRVYPGMPEREEGMEHDVWERDSGDSRGIIKVWIEHCPLQGKKILKYGYSEHPHTQMYLDLETAQAIAYAMSYFANRSGK
jgi:hypothetical protein